MNRFARTLGILAVVVLILPSWAQDEKKKKAGELEKKNDKKVEKKVKKSIFADKDPKDKDKDKKDKKSKDDNEKLNYGQYLTGKMKTIDANSQKDFTIELQLPDAKKIYDYQVWEVQAQQGIAQHKFNFVQATNIGDKQTHLVRYNQALAQFRIDSVQRQQNLTSPKDVDLRATADIKIRTGFPPTDYDDKGKLKRWNLKELKALKKGSKLPGYPADYDVLKPGQIVGVYLAKPPPAAKKKGFKIEDPVEAAVGKRPEVVMIVVVQEPLPQR
ncbi:MAG: hypothetical protein FJ271_08130 [Planctomycetes bacterium]|nr:hypothetical protein [Planctomycetota bacterium]